MASGAFTGRTDERDRIGEGTLKSYKGSDLVEIKDDGKIVINGTAIKDAASLMASLKEATKFQKTLKK